MSVWVLGVCQSRNWEAFSVDLWGQGLPKAPLQNNSRPDSWQWDTGCCCCSALKTPALPLVYHPQVTQVVTLKLVAGESRSSTYHLGDMICLVCGNALLHVNRHVCDVRHNSRHMGGFHPDLRTGIKLFTVWHVAFMIHIVTCKLRLCLKTRTQYYICQHRKSNAWLKISTSFVSKSKEIQSHRDTECRLSSSHK